MVRKNATEQIRREVADLRDRYERRCEQLWDDMVFEFGVKHGVYDEEEIEDLIDRASTLKGQRRAK